MRVLKRVAIIQVRTTSQRLPNKCLLHLFGKTVLEHIIRRLRYAKSIDEICVATTTNTSDDVIEEIAKNAGVHVYRGSEDDVLDRFYQAAKSVRADVICRVTADDPLKDPQVLDKIMQTYSEGRYDYVSNTMKPSYPEGIDIEIFSFKALEKAWQEGNMPSEREHVTPYIWKNPQLFQTYNVENSQDLSANRWTLDNAADWVFIQQIYDFLYRENSIFYMDDVLKLLDEHPYLTKINNHTVRNEGYLKSLAEEIGEVDSL